MNIERRAFLGTVAVAATSAAAGCTGGGGGDTDTPTETATATSTDPATDSPTETAMDSSTVQVMNHSELADILVDAEGMVLYMFDPDTQGSGESACYDGCAEAWPPLVVEDGDPTAGESVTAELTTFEREDGAMQVAADGWPLYYFANDEEPGDANGQGVNDVWWVLRPDGTLVKPDPGAIAAPDGPTATAEVAMISGDDDHDFEPPLVWIEAGGTVTWTLESGGHTTTAYHPDADRPNRIPEGADSWDSEFLSEEGATFQVTLEEGVYDYFCKPHEGIGMVGSIIVGNPAPENQPGLEPPQADLPDEARSRIEKLNRATEDALGASDQ